MFRLSLIRWTQLTAASIVLSAGCVPELDLESPPALPGTEGGPVEAQFDPTNPTPVLTRIPTPTIFAQNPDGTLNADAVSPAACERPTLSQCLAFVEGWPTDTPITLFFSDQINLATVGEGVELYEIGPMGQLIPVALDTAATVQIPRPAPGPDITVDPSRNPNACEEEFGYSDADLIGYDVIVFPDADEDPSTPTKDLKLASQYVLLVKSDAQGGLRDMNNNPIQPSGLFFLLNDDLVPVQEDGNITSALLRGQVQGTVLASEFSGRLREDLSDTELAALDQGVMNLGLQLRPLYDAFEAVVGLARANMVLDDRRELVYANTWTTGGPDRPTVVFDLQTPQVPFPNSELLLTPANPRQDLRVTLPVEGGPIPADVARGLNKLDGFSLRTPGIRIPGGPTIPASGPVMLFDTEAPVDESTLDDAVVMFKLDGLGQPDGEIPVVVTSSGTSVQIQPVQPLEPATTYVVGVTNDLKQADGDDFAAAATFDILKTPAPLITDGTVLSDIVPLLQCLPLTQGGDSLANVETVAATATSLEPVRARWQPTFTALEAAAVPRTSLLAAWSYTTQSIVGDIDAFRADLFAGEFDGADDRVVTTGIGATGTASVAELTGIIEQVCLPLCQAGSLGIDPADCTDAGGDPTPTLANNPLCTLLYDQLGSAERFLMRSHQVTAGNPFVDGTFDLTRLGAPLDVDIPVWLVTPVMAPPASGYPVVIFQHGLGQQKEDGFLIANTLANAGWATIMIDLPYHGERVSDLAALTNTPLGPVEVPCLEPPIDPEAVTCNLVAGTCSDGCDGVPDGSSTGFLSANGSANRDNTRQGVMDLLTLIYTLQQQTGPTGAWPDLDPTMLSFIGQSYGGITGANLIAYIDGEELNTAVLNVTGGDSTELFLNSVLSAPLYAQLNALGICEYNVANDPTSGCQLTEDFLSFLALNDWATQASDPIQTASAAVSRFGTDAILMQVSIPDIIVTSSASEALAERYDFSTTEDPQYQGYDCSVSPSSFGGHGFLLAPVCGACPQETLCNTIGAQIQAATFAASDGQVISAQTPETLGGLSCDNPCLPAPE